MFLDGPRASEPRRIRKSDNYRVVTIASIPFIIEKESQSKAKSQIQTVIELN